MVYGVTTLPYDWKWLGNPITLGPCAAENSNCQAVGTADEVPGFLLREVVWQYLIVKIHGTAPKRQVSKGPM